MDFTQATGLPSPAIPSSQAPIAVFVKGQAGYVYDFIPGSDQTNGKLKSYSAYATELAAGAYPAGETGDVIVFEALFPKLQ